ncbi:hypothetical protein BSL78_29214 [Apostichopus japonicus]|uniref:Uncharacterized protein n=1 Tax=Stichopus japonicus TaxID=307972 RepID=A0A2G8JDZ6_STIJA|nr:hypothetical protein BSL78_29214 [Apostichopus japonicus]
MSCKCRGTCQRVNLPGEPELDAHVNVWFVLQLSLQMWHEKKRPCRNKAPEESSASSEESSSDEGRTEKVQGSVEEAIDESAGSISHEANIQRYVKGLSRERLEDVATELLRRQPEALSDFTHHKRQERTSLQRFHCGASVLNVVQCQRSLKTSVVVGGLVIALQNLKHSETFA